MSKFTENQLWVLGAAVRGSGISAKPGDATAAERREWDELVELGLLKKAQNYKGDKYGMYIATEKTRKALKQND